MVNSQQLTVNSQQLTVDSQNPILEPIRKHSCHSDGGGILLQVRN